MALAEPATDCELIVAAVEPGSLDTRLSPPDCTGKLVGTSLLRLYSNEVVSLGPGPLQCSGAIVATH
jgi:hypothetical protein